MAKLDQADRPYAELSGKARVALVAALALLAITGVAAARSTTPLALWNTTPSEPEGLYLRSTELPGKGAIIAFRLPEPGFAYVDDAMPYLRRQSLLKAVAAGQGDLVCIGPDGLAINGVHLGPIAARDSRGRLLPHWIGCRRLGSDELFVFSARVPNSFDSRYFGPVSRSAVLGVYRLVGPNGGAGI